MMQVVDFTAFKKNDGLFISQSLACSARDLQFGSLDINFNKGNRKFAENNVVQTLGFYWNLLEKRLAGIGLCAQSAPGRHFRHKLKCGLSGAIGESAAMDSNIGVFHFQGFGRGRDGFESQMLAMGSEFEKSIQKITSMGSDVHTV